MNILFYKKLRDLLDEYLNQRMSKNVFITGIRKEVMENVGGRVVKIVDTSDTRFTSEVHHLPFLIPELTPTEGTQNVTYTLFLSIDHIGSSNIFTPDIFIGSILWQLENIDDITRNVYDKLSLETYKDINPDFSQVLVPYIENISKLIVYLREQYPTDFSYTMLNGGTASNFEYDNLIDTLNFGKFIHLENDAEQLIGKYHLPKQFLSLVSRVYENYISLVAGK